MKVMCTYWCNSSSAPLSLLSDPEDYESSELGRLNPYDCVRAISSVARGGKLWLRVQLPGSIDGTQAWLAYPEATNAICRVIGPLDAQLSSPALTCLSSLLARGGEGMPQDTPEHSHPTVLYLNASGADVMVHAHPDTGKVVGVIPAYVTAAVVEHRLLASGQMWARLSPMSRHWGGQAAEAWVCTSARGNGPQGLALQLEQGPAPSFGGGEGAGLCARNVFVRGGRALPLPLRAKPRLEVECDPQGMAPWTARQITAARLNEHGQLWLRVKGEGEADGERWLIRRSANDGQVVVELLEGGLPDTGASTGAQSYHRNVLRQGALPLRLSPDLQAEAVGRAALGAVVRAEARVLSRGHVWVGVRGDKDALLWAIAWNARDGSHVLQPVVPVGSGRQAMRVYRVVEGGLIAVREPGLRKDSEGRPLRCGECFWSSERRLDSKHEMWVRVDSAAAEGVHLWVPESLGGVSDSVVALDLGPTDVAASEASGGKGGRAAPLFTEPSEPWRDVPSSGGELQLAPTVTRRQSTAAQDGGPPAKAHNIQQHELQELEFGGDAAACAWGEGCETEEGVGEEHLLTEVFGLQPAKRRASATNGIMQDLDAFAEAARHPANARDTKRGNHGSHNVRRSKEGEEGEEREEDREAEDEDEEGEELRPPMGCCTRLCVKMCPAFLGMATLGWIPVKSSDTTRGAERGSGASDEFDEQLQEQEDMVQLRPIVGPTRGRGERRYSAVHTFEVDL